MKVHTRTIELLSRESSIGISTWFSAKFHCTTVTVGFDRKTKKTRDQRGLSAVIANLSKPSDCIAHNLLIRSYWF